MGRTQADVPMLRKVGVGPTLISVSVCHLPPLTLFSKSVANMRSPPNHAMSPLVDSQWLSGRCGRERHCDRDVVPPLFGRFTILRFGHFASTFLFPLAPPRFAARLHGYYGNSDFCRDASSDLAGAAKFVPFQRAVLRRRARAIGQAVSPAAVVHDGSSASCSRQISLLISFDLPTIPPPTTISPFRHGRFDTLLHRRDLPRLSPGQTSPVEGISVARSRVRALSGASPTGLAESSSLALRTGRSSQVAPHLSSRKRSYPYRLQAGNVSLRGTSTLQIKRLHRRTESWPLAKQHPTQGARRLEHYVISRTPS